ncbi:MAG: McrB family protein [Promethearchaeota archaeon]
MEFRFSEKTGVPLKYYKSEEIEAIKAIWKKHKQIILYGPPGTGKTYLAQGLVQEIAGSKYEIVQFHPSYEYEDFIEGIEVELSEKGDQILYKPKPRIFRNLCEYAEHLPENEYVALVIDEINRGDLSRIFGELIFGLETDYRDKEIQTSLSEKLGTLKIPNNLLIIGTMNSVDRSIAIVDYAIRRRFLFIELMPNEEILDQYLRDPKSNVELAEEIIHFYRSLNALIAKNKKLGRHHQIGHTYFFIKDWDEFHVTWTYKIMPLIEEYLDMDSDRIYDFLEDLRKENQSNSEQIAQIIQYTQEKYKV